MLKKLSLAALIAMGSMSVATATPLTEAIKGVDLSGYLRLRLDNNSEENKPANEWGTKAVFKMTVPVSEELKFKTSYKVDWGIKSDADTTDDADCRLKNTKFFLAYSKDQLNVIAGKIPVDTPVTDSDTGAGLVAAYTASDNLTFAVAGLDTLTSGNNVYALGAVYGQDNLNAQAWFFKVDDEIKSDIVLRVAYKMENVKINADFATAKLEATDKSQSYFNISAKGNVEGFSVMAGFAKTGKDGGVVVLNTDAPISDVLPTKQKSSIANSIDASAIYAKVGSNIDSKTNVYVAFANISGLDEGTVDEKKDYTEIVLGGSYKYTKKMKLSAYYSMLTGSGDASKDDNNRLRIEAKYSF